jgi:7-keto-8-aminopelargonate synthetase-like enzyme
MAVAERARRRGIAVQAVRPPTVPAGTSRIRLTLSAGHAPDQVDAAADALVEALRT